jgi:hypothetical protein
MGLMLRCDQPINGDALLLKTMPYYSAYIWMMFEICDPLGRLTHDTRGPNSWRRLMPVFEHGNIADGMTYRVLKLALARKALALLEDLEQPFVGSDGQPEVYFTYVCAIDDPGDRDDHPLQFDPPDAGKFSLRSLLADLANEARRTRLFPKPRRTQESLALLDSSCHLTELIDAWYLTLPAAPA